MAYITIEFGGKKTYGGFLSVDGDKQMVLSEGLMIKVDGGTHNLHYMNVPSANNTILKANVMAGNVGTVDMMLDHLVEGTITERLDDNDLMILTVVSDNNGKVLDLPTYTVTPLDEEGMAEADKMYAEQASSGIQADGSNVKTEFWICLLLGWIGAHKYYRGKVLAGLIYTFTLGIAFCGWIFDTIILLIKMLKLKKS